jgi:hypothetical protein
MPYVAVRAVVLRGLAVVLLVAFLSFWVQVDALIGADGLQPFAEPLRAAHARLGPERWWRVPTVLWLWPWDSGLHALCGAGVLASLALLAGVLEGPALLVAGVAYLSLESVAGVFLGYQWDTLLTETVFVSLFLASWGRRPARAPSPVAVWALRALLFKLMFLSGWVKLASGDPLWWDCTALTVHYWTQPLPNPLSWYAHHLPVAAHRAMCAGMFVTELVLPFLAFSPWPRPRLVFLAATVAVMGGLALTGNYGFFQLLTVVLALSLLDDAHVSRLRPRSAGPARPVATAVALLALAPWAALSLVRADLRARDSNLDAWPPVVQQAVRLTAPLRIVNAYGLFADMTESRPEIVIEGTEDGRTWVPYPFRYKPGRLDRRPPQIAPHMPRVDWQLWFAALQTCDRNPWLVRLLDGLLDADPVALSVLGADPFDGRRPAAVRALRVGYRFTDPGEPGWWREDGERRLYCPVRSRRGDVEGS